MKKIILITLVIITLIVGTTGFFVTKLKSDFEQGNIKIVDIVNGKTPENQKEKTLDLGKNIVLSEFNYANGDFSEDKVEETNSLYFEKLEPAQWHIYRISNRW